MLSGEIEHKIGQHLRLARGFLETAVVRPDGSEFEERNALSRAYYAVLHACTALVLSSGAEPSKSHGGLNRQARMCLGKGFGRFMDDLYVGRCNSDYVANWTPVRHVSEARLKGARTNVFWACREAEKKLR
jgi:uncharacterized protein (UPF0332 family)